MNSLAGSRLGTASDWQPTLWALAGSAALILYAYWDTAAATAAIWLRSETYMHGALIIPLAGWMVWRRRAELLSIAPRPSAWGLVILGLASAGWLLGNSANILVAQQFALAALLPGLVAALAGLQVVRALAFPLAYTFFAVPFGESLVPYLQDVTATIAVTAVSLSGIPVYWEGRFISIPTGDFEVAEACSGIRYLIASLAVGSLYAYLFFRSLKRRLIFIGLCLVVPVIANGLRAYGIILLAHVTDMRLATGVDHIIYGWLFFGLVMLLTFWLGSFWREAPAQYALGGKPQAPVPFRPAPSRQALVGSAALLLALSGAAAGAWLDGRTAEQSSTQVLALASGTGDWQGPLSPLGAWEPVLVGAEAVVQGTYRSRMGTVEVAAAYFAHERQGAELVAGANAVYDEKVFRRLEESRRLVRLERLELPVRETLVRGPRGGRLIWHWYEVGERAIASPVLAKLAQAWHYLESGRREGMLMMVSAEFEARQDEAEAALLAFLQTVLNPAGGNASLASLRVPGGAAGDRGRGG